SSKERFCWARAIRHHRLAAIFDEQRGSCRKQRKLATEEQPLATAARARHPALRKATAISDEAGEEANAELSPGADGGGGGGASAAASCQQPTATIVCTKGEPLCSEDIAGITPPQQQQRNTLPPVVHSHSVPPMRSSRLHDISAMSVAVVDPSCTVGTTYCRDGGGILPLGNYLIPPKSVIQDDIRMKSGRFELVKKKGRSEVWNLFGQVRYSEATAEKNTCDEFG
ncbi:unnamed protein product, partial [Gongylonema pulchrum]|uniref:PH domain-containing protein n=1 Tax=Gongylonema pulchrum TaxID=637853 RepID=A0A183D5B0_9BILA